jgi:hypothetical protein
MFSLQTFKKQIESQICTIDIQEQYDKRIHTVNCMKDKNDDECYSLLQTAIPQRTGIMSSIMYR